MPKKTDKMSISNILNETNTNNKNITSDNNNNKSSLEINNNNNEGTTAYKNSHDEFERSYTQVEEKLDNNMGNLLNIAGNNSMLKQIINNYTDKIKQEREIGESKYSDIINKDDQQNAHFVDPANDKEALETADTSLKNQKHLEAEAIREIGEFSKESKDLLQKSNKIFREGEESYREYNLVVNKRGLEIEGESGKGSDELDREIDKIEKQLQDLREKKGETSKTLDTGGQEFTINKWSNDPGEGSSKHPIEGSNIDSEERPVKRAREEPNSNAGQDKAPTKEQNKGLVEEFADPSTEPMDYTGWDD